jgi:hypothetical protein
VSLSNAEFDSNQKKRLRHSLAPDVLVDLR